MAESYLKEKKILWEKEKLLITSNFSFPLGVFKRLVWQTCRIQGLFGKGLTDSPLRFITLPPQFLSKVPRVLKPSYYEAFDLDRLSQR